MPGQAWDRTIRLGDFRTSVGGELSFDVVLGHYLPLTFAGGAAWTHDPVAAHSALGVFGRIGRAFSVDVLPWHNSGGMKTKSRFLRRRSSRSRSSRT